jgi:hypothetical protein
MNFPIKNRKALGFFIILFFNILFFSLSAYFLPIRFETNDDLAMCLFASGAYTGIPEAHLVFIHYFYGLFLSFFYKAFRGIEWYTLSFCIIHIISLSIIIYSFISTNKSRFAKIVAVILLYILELTIIQSLQFTTTAAIAAFAGIMLLFDKKLFHTICGVALFLIGTLIRFYSAMMVMLLMLPFFVYIVFPMIRIKFKVLIPVIICIFGAFLLQVFDKQAYNVEKWSYYREYNEVRGQIHGNPNSALIFNDLPNGISQGDYYLFLSFFIDGKYFDLARTKELKNLVKSVPLNAKLKNISPFLNYHKWILFSIFITSLLFFISESKKLKRLFIPLYLIYLFLILLYISLDGVIRERVFMSLFFPILYFFYSNDSIFSRKVLRVIYAFVIVLLNILLINNIYQIKKFRDYGKKTIIKEQRAIIETIKGKDIKLLIFGEDLEVESLCSPLSVKEYFGDFSLVGMGWSTNIPYNINYFDSFLSFLKKDIYLFIAKQNVSVINLLQDSIFIHYNYDTRVKIALESANYLIVKLERYTEENETQS